MLVEISYLVGSLVGRSVEEPSQGLSGSGRFCRVSIIIKGIEVDFKALLGYSIEML